MATLSTNVRDLAELESYGAIADGVARDVVQSDEWVTQFENVFSGSPVIDSHSDSLIAGHFSGGASFQIAGSHLDALPITINSLRIQNSSPALLLEMYGSLTVSARSFGGSFTRINFQTAPVDFDLRGNISFSSSGLQRFRLSSLSATIRGEHTATAYLAGSVSVDSDGNYSGTISTVRTAVDGSFMELSGLGVAGSAYFDEGLTATQRFAAALRGNDTITARVNDQTLFGFAGNDLYDFGSYTGGSVQEDANAGTDTVRTALSYTLDANVENLILQGSGNASGTGNALANSITGNAGNNVLDGGQGRDILAGGAGNDTYVVDLVGPAAVSLEDVVTEVANGGSDTLQLRANGLILAAPYVVLLGANLENLDISATGALSINATGNALANVITGSSGDNSLDGRAGADTMTGAGGNDTYIVDSLGDSVVELDSGGNDTLRASISILLGDNLENLVLTGSAANGTGNSLDNVLTGNAASNRLDGGAGADTMSGSAGSDTYVVDNVGDVINDSAGIDTVEASVVYTLGVGLENLTLTGSSSINAAGNAANNVLRGNSGDNVLAGGGGRDTLAGNGGSDTFLIDGVGSMLAAIADFTQGQDHIGLASASYGSLFTGGSLSAGVLTNAAPANTNQRLIYNAMSGALFYDPDGNGMQARVQIATFAAASRPASLNSSDFTLFTPS